MKTLKSLGLMIIAVALSVTITYFLATWFGVWGALAAITLGFMIGMTGGHLSSKI